MNWLVYLSGEIHTDWRMQIAKGAEQHNLPVSFCSAVTDRSVIWLLCALAINTNSGMPLLMRGSLRHSANLILLCMMRVLFMR